MSPKSLIIYRNVLNAMLEAEEFNDDYLDLMEAIRHEAVKRFNNCVDTLALNQEANTNSQ